MPGRHKIHLATEPLDASPTGFIAVACSPFRVQGYSRATKDPKKVTCYKCASKLLARITSYLRRAS